MRIRVAWRSTGRAATAAALTALVLTLGACGGGSDDDTTATTATTSETPPPTFAPDKEAAFLEASKDPRSGKLGAIPDSDKLEAGRATCEGLKQGLTGKEVYDTVREEIDTADVKDEELGFFLGTAVGAMCPEHREQLQKGF